MYGQNMWFSYTGSKFLKSLERVACMHAFKWCHSWISYLHQPIFNYSVIVLDYIVGYMPRHHVEGSTVFRILRDERGGVTFLMVIFSRTLFRLKDKFEVKMTDNIFKRLFLLKTEIEFLICINQFLTIQWLSSPCCYMPEAPCEREQVLTIFRDKMSVHISYGNLFSDTL
jgi:hypothetical protein